MTLLLLACNTQNPSAQIAMDPVGRIGGQVVDVDGQPLAGVSVTVDELTAVTDELGVYQIDGVTPGDELVLEFRRSGFALNYKRAQVISWETVGVDATLTEIDGFGTFAAGQGGRVEVGAVDVDFLADGVVDSKGRAYTGTVRAEVTYLDPSTDDIEFAPGDMMAKGFQSEEEGGEYDEALHLVSYGMVDVSLYGDGGEPLQLADGSPAMVKIPITNDAVPSELYSMGDGATQALWSFDPETGVWEEEGIGTVTEDEDGELYFEFEAPHFTWWNCDKPMIPTCASGYVYDMLGFPVRSARVEARGGATNTVVYTDENGYYEISVLAGDTVTFTGNTWVAAQNWSAGRSHFIDCPSGAHFCDVTSGGMDGQCYPVDDIVIDVCRESGIVAADNMKWDISTGTGEGDGLRAWFWEAEGTPALCTDPWEEMEDDECIVTTPEDYPTKFQLRTNGLSTGTRSAGSYVEFRTPRDSYRVEESSWDGNLVYEMQTIEIGPSKGRVDTVELDLRAGDVIFGSAPGSADDFFGPIVNENWMTVPGDVDFAGAEGTLGSVVRSGGLDLDVEASDGAEALVVLVTGQPEDPALLCRSNNSDIQVSSGDLSEMNSGWGSVSVYRPSTGWTMGPDGLPIRLQAMSGRVAEVELK